jgi:hypothetical protein
MQTFMPLAMKGNDECPPYPYAELQMAVQTVGFRWPGTTDIRFGMYVGFMIGDLVRLGRSVAEAHKQNISA